MRLGTKMRLSAIEGQLKNAETRLKQLECPHKNQDFGNLYGWMGVHVGYRRTCKDCGKELGVYADCESFLAAKLEYVEEEFINLRQELDKERSANDRKAKKAKA